MSFPDCFIPDPSVRCPICGKIIVQWQGEGAWSLLVWKQGEAKPSIPEDAEEALYDLPRVSSTRLSTDMDINGFDCSCDSTVHYARAVVENMVWVRTHHYAVVHSDKKYSKPMLLWPERRIWRDALEDVDHLIVLAEGDTE